MTQAASVESGDAVLAGTCQRLREACSELGVHGVSLYDAAGTVLWLTATFGPQEDDAIRKASGLFSGNSRELACIHELGQSRSAIIFRVNSPRGQWVAAAMVVVETRNVSAQRRNPAVFATAAVQVVLQEFGATRTEPKGTLQVRPAGPPNIPVLKSVVAIPASPPRPPKPVVRLYIQSLIPLRRDGVPMRHELFLGVRAGTILRRVTQAPSPRGIPGAGASSVERQLIQELRALLLRDPRAPHGGGATLSVRLGQAALSDDRFIRWVDETLKPAAIPKGRIAFEIDAPETVRNIARISKVAAFLHRAGCSLILDDFRVEAPHFGLLRLPGVRLVKLSPSLTTGEASNELSRAAILAVATMLRAQQVQTAASQVDTAEDCNRMRDLGVDYVLSERASPPKRLKVG